MIAVNGHFDGKVIIPDAPLDLPAGQRVKIRIERVEAPNSDKTAERPYPPGKFLSWIVENAVNDPSLPTDAAHQHDHYLYGTPKKPE